MKFTVKQIMDKIDYFLSVFQREYTESDREYHFFFALAMTLSELNLTESELDEAIKTYIQHTPFQQVK